MPNPLFPYMPGSTSQVGLGPDPADAYGGDSMEDFYEYLLTPRHHKRWSGSGAIKHFGPDRFASVSPEDAAMAEILLGQMEAKAQHEFQNEVRGSELGRRRAAEELMTGRGPGAGGEISFGGRTEKIAPKGPMTADERMTAQAGGFGPSPIDIAGAEAEAYGSRYRGSSGSQDRLNRNDALKAHQAATIARGELAQELRFEKGDFAGADPDDLAELYMQDPAQVPDHLVGLVNEYIAKLQTWNALAQGGGGGGDVTDEVWGGGR